MRVPILNNFEVREYLITQPSGLVSHHVAQPTATSATVRTNNIVTVFAIGELAPVPTLEYRTVASGNWENIATWETFDGAVGCLQQ